MIGYGAPVLAVLNYQMTVKVRLRYFSNNIPLWDVIWSHFNLLSQVKSERMLT